jgi:hypothetical protein
MASLSPGSVNVTPAGSLLARTGLMPDLNLPELVKLSQPSVMFLDAFPNSPYIVVASPRLGFTTFPQFEMPVLIDPFGMAQLPPMFTDAQGVGAIGFEVSPDPALLGFTYVVQAGCLDPGSGVWRFSRPWSDGGSAAGVHPVPTSPHRPNFRRWRRRRRLDAQPPRRGRGLKHMIHGRERLLGSRRRPTSLRRLAWDPEGGRVDVPDPGCACGAPPGTCSSAIREEPEGSAQDSKTRRAGVPAPRSRAQQRR